MKNIQTRFYLIMTILNLSIAGLAYFAGSFILQGVFGCIVVYFLLCLVMDHFEIDTEQKAISGKRGLFWKKYHIPFETIRGFEDRVGMVWIIPLYHSLDVIFFDGRTERM